MSKEETKPVAQPVPEAEAAPVDDVFFHLADYLYRHRKLFIGLLALVFALILVGLGVQEYLKAQDQDRDLRLYQIEQQMSQVDQMDQAAEALAAFAASEQGTPQARIARLHRANLLSAKKDYLGAQFELDQLLNQTDPKSGFYAVVQVYLANVLRDQNKLDEALAALGRGNAQVLQDALSVEKAETLMLLKKPDEARALLERLLSEYPDSLYRQRAQQLLNVLKS
ncbi:MAG: tetratricopeptide repeat protein [bacterium]|nr:tetratricopeptide repeat protein [bacterium]